MEAEIDASNLYNVKEVDQQEEEARTMQTIQTWHEKLGHLSEDSIRKMVAENLVDGMHLKQGKMPKCKVCCKGKQSRAVFSKDPSKSQAK